MAPDITSSHDSTQQEGRAGAFFLSVFFFLTSESGLSCKIPVDFTVGLSAQTGPYAHPASPGIGERLRLIPVHLSGQAFAAPGKLILG